MRPRLHFFRHAIDLDPDNPVILGNRAVLANRLGRTSDAIAIQLKSLELNPVSTIGYSNLSDVLARAGRPNEAIEAARKAVELVPDNPSARVNLAAAYLLAEQPNEALEEIDRVDWPLYQLLISAMAHHSLNQSRRL